MYLTMLVQPSFMFALRLTLIQPCFDDRAYINPSYYTYPPLPSPLRPLVCR